MLGSGFKAERLRVNLRLVINRLKLLEKKKTELAQKARKEIADYLSAGKDERARIRVEHIIREDYLVEAMEILELYCDLLLARFGLIHSMKELDSGLAEAISTLIWAAPRLQSEVAELKIVSEWGRQAGRVYLLDAGWGAPRPLCRRLERKELGLSSLSLCQVADQLCAKYSKEYGKLCRSNQIGTVNDRLMHKLSVEAPPKILVERYLIEIAKNYNVPYEPDSVVMAEAPTGVENDLIDVGFVDDPKKGGHGGGGGGFTAPLVGPDGVVAMPMPMPMPSPAPPFSYPPSKGPDNFNGLPVGTYQPFTSLHPPQIPATPPTYESIEDIGADKNVPSLQETGSQPCHSLLPDGLQCQPGYPAGPLPMPSLSAGVRKPGAAARLHLQHTTAAVSAKSYLCPVCGRALSSPGSLGRHLLIHSEDQLSNCAVCGARFTSHATFNSEKVPEVLCGDTLPVPLPEGSSGTQEKSAAAPGALTPTIYPAGILLVCNSCVAYRKLLEAQAPGVRKWAVRRQNEPLEARLQRLERERTAKKSRRDNETPEEREVRRMRDREAKRMQRLQETDEQRARRLQRDREAMRLKRANETPEKRQARLIREREAKRLKRRLEKMDIMLRAQFGQDPSAMAALAAEMNFFPLPVGSMELDSQLLGKMAFEEPSASAVH
ncbi:hypothetical protein JD844_000689 [Phrynosoma platyrhinos]|uniref:IST1 homolog n=1 Tax=Phrynosoma platyrhinos TaxID=52577 RepID=A0ABQ7SQY1_PHRPL|nr:hypothetical protein JD844_000689 [Phrynosoma platyrhinos]